MAKQMLIDATHPEETRVVVVDGTKVEEFDFESLNKRQLAGNIYLAKVTRVEPSLQAAFVDYGGNRHGFLAFSEIHPDYYQIPVADREALLREEREYAEAMADEAEEEAKPKRARRTRRRKSSDTKAEAMAGDAIATAEVEAIEGMEVVDLGEGAEDGDDHDGDAADFVPADAGDDGAHDDDGDTDTDGEGAPAAETITDDDAEEDIRPMRKPRARRYKIQEVVKVRQIMLVQVVKEERGNKGAALTTYLSLAGRYCVLMPNTARGGGISRKITNAADRKKLKEIAHEIDVPQGAGLIIRTAGSQRTKTEIKRDYEYLQRQWEQIRELTLKSIAPAPIYEEGDLIHRTIRDLYTREIDEVLVEGEAGYRHAKDFMKMIMPSHAKNVKAYTDPTPLFARYKVEGYLADMFNPTVQLRSGGYIVIGITEALVAIDVNSGRATKEGSIEETALKTNLEAAEEVARQVRLRDLAGLIVIDFIDMDERRNNLAVEKRLKDKLKTDRARIQVGRISTFGLLEMSRQRLRPGMLEATTQPCKHCHGTGLIRSDDSLALSILRQLEEEGGKGRSKEVKVIAPVDIVNYLMNEKRDYLVAIELRYGMSIRIEADVTMVSPDFKFERFKTATRKITAVSPVIAMDATLMDEIEDEADTSVDVEIDEDDDSDAPAAKPVASAAADAENGEDNPRKKRRRRRGGRGRRKKIGENGVETDADGVAEGESDAEDDSDAAGEGDAIVEAPAAAPAAPQGDAVTETVAEVVAEKPKRRSRKPAAAKAEPVVVEAAAEADASPAPVAEEAPAKPAPKPRSRSRAKPAASADAEASPKPEAVVVAAEPTPAPAAAPAKVEPAKIEPAVEVVSSAPAAEPDKPRRRGWWSKG
ncbi:Rne/Rng family ribonuclease [Roseicyclus sp.]|uniref:Rne/Rng family ribonuclease n=1 Tax=Roseicyclus sp. TaxID=1914329 RepID=UPI003F6CC49D